MLFDIEEHKYSISIHALREESDTTLKPTENLLTDFNPRSPRGERPVITSVGIQRRYSISIHALREESDDYFVYLLPLRERFQSTLSARRATYSWLDNMRQYPISIHALREESDCNKAL